MFGYGNPNFKERAFLGIIQHSIPTKTLILWLLMYALFPGFQGWRFLPHRKLRKEPVLSGRLWICWKLGYFYFTFCHGKSYLEELDGGFKYVFSPLPGEIIIQFDEHIFQMGWNHQLEIIFGRICWKNQATPSGLTPLYCLLRMIFFENISESMATFEQWKKNWLFRVYRGWNPTQLCRDYFIKQ